MTGLLARWAGVPGLVAVALLAAACSSSSPSASARTPRPTSPPPSLVRIHPGGQDLFVVPPTIPPEVQPYPFASPTPPDEATVADGTYMKIVPFADRPAEQQLPIRCFRCIPYRPDVGVSTLILFHGQYYVHHQLSGSKASGSFVVSRDRLTLFNDANCPQDVGRYTWRSDGRRLRLKMVADPCPFEHLRADDLTTVPWTRVDPCVFRIRELWPAPVAC